MFCGPHASYSRGTHSRGLGAVALPSRVYYFQRRASFFTDQITRTKVGVNSRNLGRTLSKCLNWWSVYRSAGSEHGGALSEPPLWGPIGGDFICWPGVHGVYPWECCFSEQHSLSFSFLTWKETGDIVYYSCDGCETAVRIREDINNFGQYFDTYISRQ